MAAKPEGLKILDKIQNHNTPSHMVIDRSLKAQKAFYFKIAVLSETRQSGNITAAATNREFHTKAIGTLAFSSLFCYLLPLKLSCKDTIYFFYKTNFIIIENIEFFLQ